MQEKAGLPPAEIAAVAAPSLYLGLPPDDLAARAAELLQSSDGRWGLFRFNNEIGTLDLETGEFREMTPVRFISWLPRTRGCIPYMSKKRDTYNDGDGEAVISDKLIKEGLTKDQASIILASDELKLKLPCIREIHHVRMPVLTDGAVRLVDEGFDAATGIFTLPGLDFDTDMDFTEAVEYFYNLFRHFGWRNEQRDFAIHMSCIVTLFCRGLYQGKAPMFVYNANIQESGKTTLSTYGTWLVYGDPEIKPLPEDQDAKVQEMLNSEAKKGSMYLNFDNVDWGNREIKMAVLDAWLTSKKWGFRKLGGNEMHGSVLRGVTIMSGNRMKVSPDLDRRSLIADLLNHQVGSERELPSGITLLDDAFFDDHENRKKGLAAVWAIVREWGAKERPQWKGKLKGSFEGWSRIVPAIVFMAGAHFRKNWNVFLESDNKELGDKTGAEFKQLAEFCVAQYGRDEDGSTKKTFEVTVAQMAGIARMNAIATNGLYPEIDIESVMQTEGTKGGWKYEEPKNKSQFFAPIDDDEKDRRRQASEWMTPKSRSAFGNAVKQRLNERYFRGPDGELYEFIHRIKTTPAKYLVTRVLRHK